MAIINLWKLSSGKLTSDNSTSLTFNGVKIVGQYALCQLFKYCNITSTVSFPDLIEIKDNGLRSSFEDCVGITSVSFPKLRTISAHAMRYAFYGCIGIAGTVSFPELTTVLANGMDSAFFGCKGITSISFPKLTSVDSVGMGGTFWGCNNITGTVSFPALTTAGVSITSTANPFLHCFYKCTGITKVRFPSSFSIYSDYLTKGELFGGISTAYCNTNLQITFDL